LLEKIDLSEVVARVSHSHVTLGSDHLTAVKLQQQLSSADWQVVNTSHPYRRARADKVSSIQLSSLLRLELRHSSCC
jgi:hypothetical protein